MARDYCCCALPLLNFGIYTCLAEQFVLGILAGTLAVATPSIVGASTPSFAPWILAIVCYAAAAIQILGFLGVRQEKAILFRRYTTLHIMLTLAAFAVAAVWIAISASRHSTAQNACESEFFPSTSQSSETSSEGQTLCNVFAWADIGIMAGLWAILAIAQSYFYFMVSSYGSMQRADHAQYKSLRSPVDGGIPLSDRNDPWDPRPSTEDVLAKAPDVYAHGRQESDASVATVLGRQSQEPQDYGYNGGQPPAPYQYPPYRQGSSASTRPGYNDGYPTQPSNAYTEDAGPTPLASNMYTGGYGGAVASIDRPEPFQAHPAEGSLGRKTPRIGDPY